MKFKEIKYDTKARAGLLTGAEKLAKAVTATLGPRSKNVVINQEYPAPLVVHDGVTVARAIRLEDVFEDMGATLLREAASKTNDLAGDGTTTATQLAWSLLENGSKLVAGGIYDNVIVDQINPMYLSEKLIEYSKKINDLLINTTKVKVVDRKDYEKVANVSSQNSEIGKLVADAIEKVGKDGIVMVEESNTFESTVTFQEGMEFDNGFLSPYFATDTTRMITNLKDCFVLLTNYVIRDPFDLVPLIEKVKQAGDKSLLIIAEDVTGVALQTLVMTKLKIGFPVVAVVAPEYAERRRQMLEDIALLTGGEAIFSDSGTLLKDIKLSHLGRAKSVKVTQTHTTIVPENPDSEEIQERVAIIKNQIKQESNEFKKSKLEQRLSKLVGGMAIINVGGSSDSEIREKKERFIDAVYATRAALEEGVVAGGGIALYRIADKLEEPTNSKDSLIHHVVVECLKSPLRKILSNAGYEVGDSSDIETKLQSLKENEGFNVVTGEYADMVESGIVDPIKVTRLAIQHAFSVAAMFLTTDVAISEPREKDKNDQYI